MRDCKVPVQLYGYTRLSLILNKYEYLEGDLGFWLCEEFVQKCLVRQALHPSAVALQC